MYFYGHSRPIYNMNDNVSYELFFVRTWNKKVGNYGVIECGEGEWEIEYHWGWAYFHSTFNNLYNDISKIYIQIQLIET